MTRPEALILLLQQPDEPCLRRGYRITQPASCWRDADRIKFELGLAYVAWRRQEHEDASGVVSVSSRPRFVVSMRVDDRLTAQIVLLQAQLDRMAWRGAGE